MSESNQEPRYFIMDFTSSGDFVIAHCDGKTKVTLTRDGYIYLEADEDIRLHARQEIHLHADKEIEIKSPLIKLWGAIWGNGSRLA